MKKEIKQSSMIEKVVSYKDNTLTLQYRSGAIYEYYNIDKKTYNGLLKADSVGKYIWKNILNHKYTKIN